MIIELGKITGQKNVQIILDSEMNRPDEIGRDIKGEIKIWNVVPRVKLRGKHLEESFGVLTCRGTDRVRHCRKKKGEQNK
jgi:hypothetical protein